jgi:hypothetical protein
MVAKPTDEPESQQKSTRWFQSRWVAFAIAVSAGALIWAASPSVTGASEPWDADGSYYVGALAVVGFCLGLFTRSSERTDRESSRARPLVDVPRLLAVYAGIFGGQLAYVITFLPAGPLLALGIVFLGAFSLVTVIAAAVGGGLRRAMAQR